MALTVASPTAGELPIIGAVVIGTLDASGNFVQYASVSYHAPVRVATTTNGTLATAFANGQTVDGITLATGDRILLKNQSTASQNGIYVVEATGAPSRAADMDTWTEVPGAVVGVLVGTTNADTVWICTSDSGGTLGSTAINWSAFGSTIATPVAANLGGTGVANNAASTLTISGNFGTTFTVTGATTVTLPTTGTLLSNTTKVTTTLTTEQARLNYDGTNYMTVTVGSNSRTTFALEGSSPYEFRFQLGGSGGGDAFMTLDGDGSNNSYFIVGRGTSSNIGVSTSGARSAAVARFCMSGSGQDANPTGIGDGGADKTIAFMCGADGTCATLDAASFRLKAATDLQLGNAYVNTPSVSTGYVLIKDSTGTVYEIPAKAH